MNVKNNKVVIVCNNENEFIEVQKELFKQGLLWCTSHKRILNYRTAFISRKDISTNKRLIICNFDVGLNMFYYRGISELPIFKKYCKVLQGKDFYNNLKFDIE